MSVIFTNPGVIDTKFITTFGVSAKEGTNPIGFFGTGLKYAIAVLLRDKQQIKIQAGQNLLEFSTRSDTLRGKDFDFIVMRKTDTQTGAVSESELPFTTELGKNWKLWQAYRELYCNCLDEAGNIYESNELVATSQGIIDNVISLVGKQTRPMDIAAPEPKGRTIVTVAGRAIEYEHSQRETIILTSRPDFACSAGTITDRPSSGIYLKNVKALEPKIGVATYNILTSLELTEDRTIKSESGALSEIAKIIMKCTDKTLLRKILLAPDGYFERTLTYYSFWSPSDQFLDVVGKLRLTHLNAINPSALKVYEDCRKQVISDQDQIFLTPQRQRMLDKAVTFCRKHLSCSDIDNYPIYCVNMQEEVLGLYKDNKIFLNERVFRFGMQKLVQVVFEEWLHATKGFDDCTREMQNYLFERLIEEAQELSGEDL